MKIAPSILTANFLKLEEEIKSIDTADFIHVDVMDGNFVPNISFGPYITKCVNEVSKPNLDIHLMVQKPLDWIDKFVFSKTSFITVHYESDDFLVAIDLIKKHKVKVGISIKPSTSVKEIEKYLNIVDLVLVMSVEPGFGGQKFIASSIDKIKELNLIRENKKLNFLIEVDGGVNDETIKLCKDAKADIIVVGSYLFNQTDRKKTMEKLR